LLKFGSTVIHRHGGPSTLKGRAIPMARAGANRGVASRATENVTLSPDFQAQSQSRYSRRENPLRIPHSLAQSYRSSPRIALAGNITIQGRLDVDANDIIQTPATVRCCSNLTGTAINPSAAARRPGGDVAAPSSLCPGLGQYRIGPDLCQATNQHRKRKHQNRNLFRLTAAIHSFGRD